MCAYRDFGKRPLLFSFTNGFKDFPAFVCLSNSSIGLGIVRFFEVVGFHMSLNKRFHLVVCSGELTINIRLTELFHLVCESLISSVKGFHQHVHFIHLFDSSEQRFSNLSLEVREFSFSTFRQSGVSLFNLCFFKCFQDRCRNVCLVDLLTAIFDELFRCLFLDSICFNHVAFIQKTFTQAFIFSLQRFHFISFLHVTFAHGFGFVVRHTFFFHVHFHFGLHVVRHLIHFFFLTIGHLSNFCHSI